MRCVIQRVRQARVLVEDTIVGSIQTGYLVLVAVHQQDTPVQAKALAKKIAQLRLFPDEQGKFDRDLAAVSGSVLLVSQFTLYADTKKGRRPSFHLSAPPALAAPLCDVLRKELEKCGVPVETGVFGAMMQVELINDGPVTLILEEGAEPGTSGAVKQDTASEPNPELPPLETFAEILRTTPQFLFRLALPPAVHWNRLPASHQEAITERLAQNDLAAADFRDALFELLLTTEPQAGLSWFLQSGILARFIPELCETVHLSSEDDRRHKHVWDHTLQVVLQIPATLPLRLAALFHDIGKVRTRQFTGDGKVTFYGHDRVGGRMFRKIAARLQFPEDLSQHVTDLVRLHLRPGQYLSSWTDSAVRRFHRELPDGVLEDLLALGRADITSKRPGRREQAVRMIDELERRIREIFELDNRLPPLPTGLGNVLMETFSLPPGPDLGRCMKLLMQEVEEERLLRGESFDYYVEALRQLAPDRFP